MRAKYVRNLIACALFSVVAGACSAQLVSAQGSGHFPVKGPPAPPALVEVDCWSAGVHTLYCDVGVAVRNKIEVNNTSLTYSIQRQENTGPTKWVDIGVPTAGSFSASVATTFVWNGYRYYFGTTGDDTWNAATAGSEPCIAFGFDGDDTLTGSTGRDYLFGQNGDDTLIGGDGPDELWGNPGKDTLRGEDGSDKLHLGSGTGQFAYGGDMADIIYGGGGQDTLCGYLASGDENVSAPYDNDQIITGGGADTVWAGPGDDKVWVDVLVGIDVNISGGNQADEIYLLGNQGKIFGDYSLPSGGSLQWGDEIIVSTAGRHDKYVMKLGGGDDVVFNGGSGDDHVSGQQGDDKINGGGGKDTLNGDEGEDELWANGSSEIEFVFGGADNDNLWGGLGRDWIYGQSGDDRIAGDDGTDDASGDEDTIAGDEGDDVIWGEGGDDVLDGDQGADRIYGGEGGDNLDGGAGNDTLIDRTHLLVDTLDGDAGEDILDVYNGPPGGADSYTIDIVNGGLPWVDSDGNTQTNRDKFYMDDRDLSDYDPINHPDWDHGATYNKDSEIKPLLW